MGQEGGDVRVGFSRDGVHRLVDSRSEGVGAMVQHELGEVHAVGGGLDS